MLYVYTGTDSRYYGDYLNRLTGRMLEAEPGLDLYEIDVAPGRNPTLPVPPGDGRWHAATAEQIADFTDGAQVADIIAGAEALPEPAAETAEDAALEPAAEVPPDGTESEPGAPEGEPVPEDQEAPESGPETPADEATDHPEGVE